MNGFKIAFSLFIFSSSILPCSSYDETENCTTELRIIIIGKIGVGKSSTGNVILGKKVFDANPKSDPVTLEPATEKSFRFNKHLTVVDTPGFVTSNISQNEDILNQITSNSVFGFNAIVLVLDFSTFNENEKLIEFLKGTFPKESFEKLIVVFTKLEGLDKNDEQLADVLGSYNKDKKIKQLLKLINGRYFPLYHHTSVDSEESERAADVLIQKMDSLSKTSVCLCLANFKQEWKGTVPKKRAFSAFTRESDVPDSMLVWFDLFKNGFVMGIFIGAIFGLLFTVSLSGFIISFIYPRKWFDEAKFKSTITNEGNNLVMPTNEDTACELKPSKEYSEKQSKRNQEENKKKK